jgi:methylenetetrahydrofolate reductase (NADPH)
VTDTILSSAMKEVAIGFDRPFVIIGERINPTGRKKLADEMAAGDFSTVVAVTLAQVEAGAQMLERVAAAVWVLAAIHGLTRGSVMLFSRRCSFVHDAQTDGKVPVSWKFWRRRRAVSLTEDQRASLKSLVADARYELIPLKNALDRAEALPPGVPVTVTASPSHGIESTFDLAEAVASRGHEVTPHLSAHMLRDRGHLAELLQRSRDAGLRSVFVVGGDARDRGEFHDGVMLLRTIHELGNPFGSIGVPAYPEGHPDIPPETLLRALRDKQPLATWMTTQMSFNPAAVAAWVGRIRTEGVTLPVHLGIPGVAELTKLMAIAARIGVADSARYLKKNKTMLGHLMRGGAFGPDTFLEALAPELADPVADVRALHVFTFNQVQETAAWQRRMLDELAG